MLKGQKEKVVESLVEDLRAHEVMYLVDFQGLNMEQITDLRRRLRKSGSKLRVVKNTLLRISHEKAEMEPLKKQLTTGSSALILSANDPVAPAKVIREFLRENSKPQVKAIIVNRMLFDAGRYVEFAALPGVEQLRANAVAAISAPIRGLVFVLAGLLRGVVAQLDQIAKKRSEI